METNLPAAEQKALDEKNKRDAAGADNDDEGSGSESEDVEPEKLPYMQMFSPETAREFLGKSWVVFSIFFGLYYLLQFGLALMCANYYGQSHPIRLQPFEYVDAEKGFKEGDWNPNNLLCGAEADAYTKLPAE